MHHLFGYEQDKVWWCLQEQNITNDSLQQCIRDKLISSIHHSNSIVYTGSGRALTYHGTQKTDFCKQVKVQVLWKNTFTIYILLAVTLKTKRTFLLI